MNELTTLAKYIYTKLTTDPKWSQEPINNADFYSEIISGGNKVDQTPAAMVVTVAQQNMNSNFGSRMKGRWLLQIKAVMAGEDFSLLSPIANLIEETFHWPGITDINTGRPKCQELWTDPDDSTINIRIMSCINNRFIKYSSNQQGTDYINLGGIYEMEYYQE